MEPTQGKRILAVDAFRGFTIAAMILVDSPGSYRDVYPQLKHAAWNGWTFADTIFPFFLFIMGVSMVFSFAGRKEAAPGAKGLDVQVVDRTVVLFLLGLFMNAYPLFHLSTLRVMGILQRTALCYFFAALIMIRNGPRGQCLWLAGLLAAYSLMMRFIPVPGVGAFVLEPGKNLAGYLDSILLHGHMYGAWEPEGVLSTLPAIVTTLFGALAGNCLRLPLAGSTKTLAMAASGMGLAILGVMLDRWMPINKTIWTSSFSILMAGLAFLALSVFYWLTEVRRYTTWAKVFMLFGMNSIAIYVLAQIVDPLVRVVLHRTGEVAVAWGSRLPTAWTSGLESPQNESLLFGLSYVLVMYLVAWSLWKRKIFIKI
ncbi:acyltransferase family protein [Desulforhabdus sp. TSK]|uniref:acyltransferase family protein n=1 Tax=Desulforhabdus sp. TSK TaxID=2925014 RepID=UPI001FC7EE4F|nr:heparan-alpha-glucosaminide N-acetyltransferase domain-containing protein [Desulforhabdus sp. TSK]